MPQSLNQKAVNNFIKGLITEAGEMTFPEGASTDELNCDLRRDGTRRRRLGVKLEDNHVLNTATQAALNGTKPLSSFTWKNVAGDPSKEYLVVHNGVFVLIYDQSAPPYSGKYLGFVDISTLTNNSYVGVDNTANAISFTSINGLLIGTHATINNSFVVEETSTGVFSISAINFRIRDFRYFTNPVSTLYTESVNSTSAINDQRRYDTLNSGWASENNGRNAGTTLNYYKSISSNLFPALTHPWFSGKNTSDQFDKTEWEKIDGGNSLSGNGHFIIDFFSTSSRLVEVEKANRYGSAGTDYLTSNVMPGQTLIQSRWRSCEAFSGRVFFGGLDNEDYGGSIVFSKLIDSKDDIGECFQQNDPTSEHLSTLLPTDGGMITIPDADKIQRLYAYQNSIYVFAENGVWQISGVDGVFKADAYSVNRVSRVGILNAQSFVAADGAPFWWSRYGIHTLSTDPVSGQGAEQNISVTTIQGFWDNIDADAREKVIGKFDPINKRIYWGYPNKDASPEYKINNFLILDITLGAFYPWKIEDKTSQQYKSFIVGFEFYSGFGSDELVRDVRSGTNGVDDVLSASGANDVVSTAINYHNTGDPNIILLISATADQIPSNRLTMGSFSGGDYKDWGETDYTSFAETGYDFVGDAILKKNAPYLVTYCRVTETGFTGNPQAGYEAVNPSGLLVSSSFDFRETFSPSQQVYRKKYPVVVDPNNLDLYDYPEDVITSRVKLRGHGRSMRLRYESETGKDFILIGWGIVQGRNPRY